MCTKRFKLAQTSAHIYSNKLSRATDLHAKSYKIGFSHKELLFHWNKPESLIFFKDKTGEFLLYHYLN